MKMTSVMTAKSCFSIFSILTGCFLIFSGCDNKPAAETNFSKADSLTETYLALQDSMLGSWNSMINDDNRKIKAMRHLLHELSVSNPEKMDELKRYEGRIDGLAALRYDQHTMSDSEIVSEYDFASNSLVSELVSLAEAQQEFAYNKTLQQLVDNIRAADQRVNNYREDYDEIATRFNLFIEGNRKLLKDMDENSFLEKRPLFQMASE